MDQEKNDTAFVLLLTVSHAFTRNCAFSRCACVQTTFFFACARIRVKAYSDCAFYILLLRAIVYNKPFYTVLYTVSDTCVSKDTDTVKHALQRKLILRNAHSILTRLSEIAGHKSVVLMRA